MNPETRQTVIGIIGLTAVEVVALLQGFNGPVTVAYFVAVVALVTPGALDALPFGLGGAG